MTSENESDDNLNRFVVGTYNQCCFLYAVPTSVLVFSPTYFTSMHLNGFYFNHRPQVYYLNCICDRVGEILMMDVCGNYGKSILKIFCSNFRM